MVFLKYYMRISDVYRTVTFERPEMTTIILSFKTRKIVPLYPKINIYSPLPYFVVNIFKGNVAKNS